MSNFTQGWLARASLVIASILIASGSARAAVSKWASTPTPDEVAASYPAEAHQLRIGGETELICGHDREGRLKDCKVQYEVPKGRGFGAAALSLAPKFQLRMDGPQRPPASVPVPFFYGPPGPPPPDRDVVFHASKGRFARLAPAGPYWPEKALRLAIGGSGTIDCHVKDDGQLYDCGIVDEDPMGSGFADSLYRMAETGWMTAGPIPKGVVDPPDGLWRFHVVFPPKSLTE